MTHPLNDRLYAWADLILAFVTLEALRLPERPGAIDPSNVGASAAPCRLAACPHDAGGRGPRRPDPRAAIARADVARADIAPRVPFGARPARAGRSRASRALATPSRARHQHRPPA